MYRVKRFFKRIHNLYRWFPIIWKDQDWDDHYIWEILKFKLQNQAKYISKHDRHTRAQRDAWLMLLCIKLIEKIQTEYYSGEYMGYEETEFRFKPSTRCVDCKELNIVTISDNLDEYLKKYPLIVKKVMREKVPFSTTNKRGVALNVGYINHKRAKKLLFKILEENIEGWWN